jgi:hypothetical protein
MLYDIFDGGIPLDHRSTTLLTKGPAGEFLVVCFGSSEGFLGYEMQIGGCAQVGQASSGTLLTQILGDGIHRQGFE